MPGSPPCQARIARQTGAGQAHAHTRLQDAVAGADPLPGRVVDRTVQRVRHGADELARGVARQLRVRIQGDHVFHAGQHRGGSDHQGESVAAALPQQAVQVRQLAALALVTHPDPVMGVPAARAMEQEEDVVPTLRVLRVQGVDPLPGQLQQRRILSQRFLRGVAQIGQQAEVQVGVAIGQEPDFQRLDEGLDVARAGEHGRDHHQGARCRGDARGEIHTRQRMRRRQQSGQPVHQRDRELAGRKQRECAQRQQCPIGQPVRLRLRQQTRRQEYRDQRDRAQIQQQRELAPPCAAARRSVAGVPG